MVVEEDKVAVRRNKGHNSFRLQERGAVYEWEVMGSHTQAHKHTGTHTHTHTREQVHVQQCYTCIHVYTNIHTSA